MIHSLKNRSDLTKISRTQEAFNVHLNKNRAHLRRATATMHLPRWRSGNQPACNAGDAGDAGDAGSIPRSGRSPGGGNGNPLQHSQLENTMDRGAWQAAVHGVAEGQTRPSLFTFMHWRRKWQPTPAFWLEESQGQGSLVGCHLWGHTESDMTEAT